MPATPTTFAPTKQFVGVAAETAGQGSGTPMTSTVLVDSVKAKDNQTFLDDKSWRGSMATDSFAKIPGTKTADIELGGPAYGDGLGFWLRNILGDVAWVGTSTGSGGTTLSVLGAVGASSIQTAATIPAGTTVQIGSGSTAECFITGTPTGAGPYTIPLTTPVGGLVFQHAIGQPVQPVTGPYSQAYSLLNGSGSSQPMTHALTHFLGPTAATGARIYPGLCLSELGLKWSAESELLTWSGKGTSWASIPAGATPVANPSTVLPVASWRMVIGIGGPAAGGTLISTVSDGELTIKRELEPKFTTTGSQNPYIIQRGGVSVEGKLTFVAADESPLLWMLNNTQPSLQLILDNGLTGPNKITFQVDLGAAAFTDSEADGSKSAVEYSNSFNAILTTTNAGGSGGYSPIKVTMTNNVAPGTF
ncbi:phage tail tube protein [Streptomyces sp. NPDC007851]|uniref:phage tail tube protein n=1 Tax=Streptomyces sp. NPDC007851 TaxID=3155008 RepID=UPI0033D9A865